MAYVALEWEDNYACVYRAGGESGVRVKKKQLIHNLFLVYFVNLYIFRAYLCPSSGGTNVCIQQLVLVIIFR